MPPTSFRSPAPRTRPSPSTPILPILLTLMLLGPAGGEAQLSTTGKWTPPSASWGNTQIHLALLRGDAGHHSKLISWGKGEHGVPLASSLWGWNPSGIAADGNCSAYPGSSMFTPLALDQTMVNLFCTGHSTLADGTLLIGGGHDRANIIGLRQSTVFRPNAPAGQQWAPQGSMAYERWYPTQTTLPDGKVMTFAGTRFYHMAAFGGTREVSSEATATRDTIEQLGLTPAGRWLPPAREATANWPAPREAHSAVWRPDTNEAIVFGGRGNTGATRNDAWRVRMVLEGDLDGNPPLTERYKYGWEQIPASDPPEPRKQHVAVLRHNHRMVIYGGRRTASAVLSDVHELSGGGTSWGWAPKVTVGTSPGARYGHAAVYDHDNDRMLVFGGSVNQGGTLADNDLYYALALSPLIQSVPPLPDTLTWTRITLPTKPASRSGHTLVLDPFLRDGPDADSLLDDRRAILFGARGAGDANDLWELWLTGSSDPEWRAVGSPSGGPPSGLHRHAAFWDRTAQGEVDRMVVYGGQDGTSAIASAWALDAATMTWTQLPTAQPAVPLAGHTAMFHPGKAQASSFMALDAERFTPGSPGSWAAENQPRWQPTYALMFVLPSGNLFQAGASWESYIYETDSTMYWKQVPPKPAPPASPTLVWSTSRGGSGVQFRPGEIMKCGHEPFFGEVSGSTDRIKFNAQDQVISADWDTSANRMQPRNYHNLTMLPNGKVLVSGGLPNDNWPDKNAGAVNGPQIWDPQAANGMGQWTAYGVLEAEGARRGYHSTALLLPDGRVLSAGGEPDVMTSPANFDPNSTKATIFCPPYLFKPSGELAARPTIVSSHTEIGYGQSFTVNVGWDMPIQSACLIRPGAVTHGFNQDQYFIPLQFSMASPCKMVVSSPPNANYAPPGDYLLFVTTVEATTQEWVPSIGKWVRLREGSLGTDPPEVSCEIPGGCPMVDARTAQGWRHENSILGRSLTGEHSTDVYRLRSAPEVFDGRLQLRIRENENEYTTLDQVRLWAVDHDPGQQAFATGTGVVLGERRPAYRVTTHDGRDVTYLLDGEGEMFQGQAGDTLMVEMTRPASPGVFGAGAEEGGGEGLLEEPCCEKNSTPPGGFRLDQEPLARALEDQRVLTRTGLVVQVPDGAGGWRTVQHRYPRERDDQVALDLAGQQRMRLIFMGRQRLRFVGRVVRTGEAQPAEVGLLAARHSRLGDALQPVLGRDGSVTALDPGDTLHLEFAATPVPEGKVRDWFLVSTGVYTSDPAKAGRLAGTQVVPARFALAQNRPNPFSNATTIRFELPVAAKVKLEVFDLLGRRMATLANREYPAGYHAVEWDRRGAAPGVYLYRITAGRFGEQKKMTLLP